MLLYRWSEIGPNIFNAVADALLWIMGSLGVSIGIHYLDYFLG